MSFFLGETREREGQSFATGEEYRSVTETMGDAWRRNAASAPAGSGVLEDAPTDAQIAAQGRLFTAARRSQELVDSSGARANAIADAYDNRIETVRRVTGVTLENPERNAYYKEAEAEYGLLRDQGAISLHDVQNGDSFSSRRIGLQREIFNRKVDELAQSQPDKASALAFGQSIGDQAKAIAGAAAAELDTARRDGPAGVGGFLYEVGGALAGLGRDPGNVAALFAGGGPGTAVSVLGRLAQVGLREGLINAAIEALQQPGVQAWRSELSLKHGLEPALENIGVAFLFGAGIGGGVQGLGEVFGRGVARVTDQDRAAMQAVLRGEASSAEIERVAGVLGVKLDDVGELAIARRFEADDAMLPPAPAGVSRADHNDALVDAMRAAEDPSLPPAVEPLRADRLDPAVFAERPALAAYADEPPQTVLGLAALRADVWRAVDAGEVDAVHASWIGRMAPDAPDSHGGLLRALQDASPETVAEARLVIRDAMAAGLRREAQDAILGAIGQETELLARRLDPELFAAIDAVEARAASLRAELGRVQAQDAAGTAPLAPRVASLETELAGITGKRRSSPRAQALRDEIERLRADQDLLRREADQQLRDRETSLRLGVTEAEMDRARLGPRLRAVRETAEAQGQVSPEIAALRERLAVLDAVEPPPTQRPPLRPAEAIEPGSPEAVRQADARLPEIEPAVIPVKDAPPATPPALSEMIPVAGRSDGRDMRALTLQDALREAERPAAHGELIAACKL